MTKPRSIPSRPGRAVSAKGADYLFALKDNQPTLAVEVRLFFEREDIAACDCFETTDGDHGRIEARRHKISHGVSWLTTDRPFPGEPRFPALAMVGNAVDQAEWPLSSDALVNLTSMP